MAMKHGGRGPGHLSRWTAATSPIPYLFASGSQGAWFDFTDTSTWYQDAARTTPAATLGDVVGGIADKSGRGNHASQATTAQKPLRARIPLGGRRNMLTYTEDFSNAFWTKGNLTVEAGQTAPDGSVATKLTTSLTSHSIYQYANVSAGSTYTFSFYVIRGTQTELKYSAYDATNSANIVAPTSYYSSTSGSVFVRISFTITAPAGCSQIIVYPLRDSGTTGTVFIRNAQLERAAAATAYQKVVADWDVTESGVTSIPALYFDGSDDSLATAAIDFTGTDKMTVFAGVEKLSDAAQASLVELSASVSSNNGSFAIQAPRNINVGNYSAFAVGTVLQTINPTGFTAPATNVLTFTDDISGDSLILRVNGAQAGISTSDQGTGNYGNYALYLGRRGGASLPFKGYMIGHMVIVGKLANASEIAAVEALERAATGAY